MRTDKQRQTSISNGSKSKGPITDSGKAKSAKNAMTHGFSTGSGHVTLLSNESVETFEAYTQAFLKRFQPIDLVELELVQQMISAVWRLRRMDAAETAIIDLEIDDQRPKIEELFESIDETTRNGLAIRRLVEQSKSIDLFTRYRAQARRAFTTALKTLQLLQGPRFNTTVPIEPDAPFTSIPCNQASDAPVPETPSATTKLLNEPEADPEPGNTGRLASTVAIHPLLIGSPISRSHDRGVSISDSIQNG